MPDDAPGSGEPFDIEKLRELIELMEKHDLTEVSLRHGEQQWRLRRGPRDVLPMVPPPGPYAAPVGGLAPPPVEPPPPEPQLEPGIVEITSPTVGTFYSSPTPDEPPFVSVGSQIQVDSIVCIIEAMKVFNQIPAEVNGSIVEFLVNNGDPVEFGQPLFRVRPG